MSPQDSPAWFSCPSYFCFPPVIHLSRFCLAHASDIKDHTPRRLAIWRLVDKAATGIVAFSFPALNLLQSAPRSNLSLSVISELSFFLFLSTKSSFAALYVAILCHTRTPFKDYTPVVTYGLDILLQCQGVDSATLFSFPIGHQITLVWLALLRGYRCAYHM